MSAKDTGSALLDLRLFGQAEVRVRGLDITGRLSKRAQWLMAILALREGRPIERHRLAGMIWPESTDAAALFNLRQTLASLRKELGEAKGCLQAVSPRSVVLPLSADVRVDVTEFDGCCKTGRPDALARALDLYKQPLLIDCDEPFALTAREARTQAFLLAADQLAGQYVERGEYSSAARVLQRVLAEDPYRETSCRALMSALADSGDASAALELCREFRLRLRRDLNSEISQETKSLYRRIRAEILKPRGLVARDRRIPIPLTGLVGRQPEIRQVISMLNRCRLVTLTGPGGVGKTRLSLAVAEAQANLYLDGAHFVDLAPLTDPDTISSTVAGVLNIPEQAGRSMLEVVGENLRDRELLLVFDNCEHLTPSISEVIESLLSASLRLHVLATSRQSLGVTGELVWPVPPLPTPASASGALTPAQSEQRRREILDSDAVRLFLQRSGKDARTKPGSADELETIGSICRRLDGLPLAIELAAARTKVLSVSEIESRLSDRLAVLANSGRAPARHQTLQACIEWSWDLLAAAEQQVLMDAAVFRGGCTLEALEAVGEAGEDTLDLVASLADRSLLNVDIGQKTTRYFVLETIRQFALQKLRERGDFERVLDKHRDYFLWWAEDSGSRKRHTVDEPDWFEDCEIEHDNLRAALSRCHQSHRYELALHLAISLSRFWDTCGHVHEGRQQLEAALVHETPDMPEEARASAHTLAGWMATVQRDSDTAIRHFEQSIPAFRKLNEHHSLAKGLNCLGNAHVYARNFAAAKSAYEEALAIYRDIGMMGGVASVYSNLAEMSLEQGDSDAARAYAERSVTENAGAKFHAEVSGQILATLSLVDLRQGRIGEALTHAQEAVRMFQRGSTSVNMPAVIEQVGVIHAAREEWPSAVRLLAASEKLAASLTAPLTDVLAADHTEALAKARKCLPSSTFESQFSLGCAMGLEEAADQALNFESAVSRSI